MHYVRTYYKMRQSLLLRSRILLQHIADYYKMWRYYIMNWKCITLLHNVVLQDTKSTQLGLGKPHILGQKNYVH